MAASPRYRQQGGHNKGSAGRRTIGTHDRSGEPLKFIA